MDLQVLTAVVAILGLAVAAGAARIDALPVSEPLIGLVVGVLVGPQVLGLVSPPDAGGGLRQLHEVAGVLLAVSVMAIALRYPVGTVRRRGATVGVLLAVVMPVMAVASAVAAVLVLGPAGLAWGVALALGAALCPTDPVLSSSVVTGDLAERDVAGRTRELLSLESGANDGLALPLVVVAVAVAAPLTAGSAALEVARQVLGALVLGGVAGAAAAAAIRTGRRHGATQQAPAVVFTVLLALGVLAAARLLSVGGVLAVFVAGLVLNALWDDQDRLRALTVDEAVNRYAVLPLFLVLGIVLPWSEWVSWGWVLVPGVLAMMVLRRLPWLLLLARPLRLPWRDAVFLGWFGPVGVSAAYYLTEIEERVPDSTHAVAAGLAVVAMSTVLHGLTGSPGRVLYRRAAARAGDRADGG